MEFAGHQRTFEFILTTGIIITTFVSDRHASIAKWMREELPRRCSALGKPIVNHFFDLWHIGKSKFQKVILNNTTIHVLHQRTHTNKQTAACIL